MITISNIDLYNLLKTKIGEVEAKTLTEFIEVKVKDSFEQEKSHLATKQDISEAKAELLKWMIVMFAPFYVGMIVFLVKQFMW